jgi:hypothetical protein
MFFAEDADLVCCVLRHHPIIHERRHVKTDKAEA